MDADDRRDVRLGRAVGWVGVGLTGASALASVVVMVDVVRDRDDVLGQLGWFGAWVAVALVPLVFVATMAAQRLRFVTRPPLVLPSALLVAGTGVLFWSGGVVLLVPAAAFAVASLLLRSD